MAEAGVVAHGMEPVASFESVRGPWEELDPPISAARRAAPSPILGAACALFYGGESAANESD